MLEELEDEARWKQSFSKSQNVLAKLAADFPPLALADQGAISMHHLPQLNCRKLWPHPAQGQLHLPLPSRAA